MIPIEIILYCIEQNENLKIKITEDNITITCDYWKMTDKQQTQMSFLMDILYEEYEEYSKDIHEIDFRTQHDVSYYKACGYNIQIDEWFR